MTDFGNNVTKNFQFYILAINYALYKHENINLERISVQLGVLMGTFAVSVQGRPFISILSR